MDYTFYMSLEEGELAEWACDATETGGKNIFLLFVFKCLVCQIN